MVLPTTEETRAEDLGHERLVLIQSAYRSIEVASQLELRPDRTRRSYRGNRNTKTAL